MVNIAKIKFIFQKNRLVAEINYVKKYLQK